MIIVVLWLQEMNMNISKKSTVYKREFFLNGDFYEEFLGELADEFFSVRSKKRFSLDEVSAQTGVAVKEIDKLESGLADIDFEIVLRLCEFYNYKLNIDHCCFPGLPKDLVKKCLAY